MTRIYKTGEKPGKGKYKCMKCSFVITLKSNDEILPECPVCKIREYEKIGEV